MLYSGLPSNDLWCSLLENRSKMRFSNDPSEEMILQNEWRRDRMHQAVDEVEACAHGRWCDGVRPCIAIPHNANRSPYSPNGHDIDKKCLIGNCFAWCLEHQQISTEADGEETVETHITDRDQEGNVRQRVIPEIQRRCRKRRLEPVQGDYCDVVESGADSVLFRDFCDNLT